MRLTTHCISPQIRELHQSLRRRGVPVFGDISLAPFTAFATGGNAQLLLLPRSREELFTALELAEKHELPLSILGGGANVLVADAGVRGAVLSLRGLQGLEWRANLLLAEAGWDMSALCRHCARHNAAGLHYFYGMPGSLGGAVYMNARCYEGEMAPLVRRVLCLPRLGGASHKRQANFYRCRDLRWVELNSADWCYKYSHFQHNAKHKLAGALIVAVELILRQQPRVGLEREMQNFLEDRILKGHFRLPCGGSFFKNNRAFGAPTGQIIDSLGLKGRRLGRAQLAPWHGNIIVNTGRASASEIWQLAELVRNEVQRRTGLKLESEIQRLGTWQ